MTLRLLKFSITIRIECAGFSLGAWPYFSSFHIVSKVARTDGDLWEKPRLIGVHCLLKFVDTNKYILFAFIWGWVGSVGQYVQCFCFGGAYTLSLTVHVSLLHFFRLKEIACNICDIDQGPRVVIALLDCFEPRLFHRKSLRRM